MTIDSSILILAYFANFKLAGDRVVRDAIKVLRREREKDNAQVGGLPLSRPSTRLRRRRRTVRARHLPRSARVGVMTDADLEAELAARRAARARERDRYARAMRSEKLSLLETELMRLRSEISRMDRPGGVRGGTPPTARWESLPGARGAAPRGGSPVPVGPPAPNGQPTIGIPPPPPPPMMAGGPDDDGHLDPERQKREKAERLLRREAKRKEREQAKKPLTLAEIIRGAGPDPMKRLKPSGSTQLEDILEPEAVETEDFSQLKGSLKKRASSSNQDGTLESGIDETNSNETNVDASKNAEKSSGDDRNLSNKDSADENKAEDDKEETAAKKRENAIGEDNEGNGATENLKDNDIANADSTSKSSKSSKINVSDKVSSETKEGSEETATSAQSTKLKSKEVSAADALSAVSALAAKLPAKQMKMDGEVDAQDSATLATKPLSSPARKRATLEERRRLRREASNKNADQSNDSKTNGDTTSAITDSTTE